MSEQTRPYRVGDGFYTAVRVPSGKLECAFYLAFLYSLTAEIWGVSVPVLAGALFLALGGICLLRFRDCLIRIYRPIASLIACGVAFVVVQVFFHGVSILDGDLRTFIIWMLQLIIVHSLCLRRGFSYRYPLALLAIAVLTLPFISFDVGEIERARVEADLGIQGGLSHPGGLAEWFGFFAVYFAISGLETNRFSYRAVAWAAAVGCLFVVALTVSRGPIFSALLAMTFGFRGILRRGFTPILVLVLTAGTVYESGMFDQAAESYEERATEASGREILWPAAVEKIFSSPEIPFIGVGMSQVLMYELSARKANPPHNTFLYFALSSGVLPFAFFVAFWIQAAWRSIHLKGQEADVFRAPYLLYAFVSAMLGDSGFMSPWALLAMSLAAGSTVLYKKQPFAVLRAGNEIRLTSVTAQRGPGAPKVARP